MTTTTKINKGYQTEEIHYQVLKETFGEHAVSKPKGAAGGSDFIVVHDDKVVTFESKSHGKDMFDAGTLSVYANGMIYCASAFLTNNHITQISYAIEKNMHQVQDYTSLANTNSIPHIIHKEIYNDIKKAGKLINIVTKEPLENIIESSFHQGKNAFAKAHYLIIDKSVYCISDKKELDPLNLLHYGAEVLNDAHIDNFTIRSSRGGSKGDYASCCMRVYFKLKKDIPKSKVILK